jgi:hypothetical protein
MKALCDVLKVSTAEVVRLWEEASVRQPWLLLPEHDRVDHLPEVLECVADAVLCEQPTREGLLALARAAAKHGHDRVRQGLPDILVLSEYHLLRDAIWAFFRRLADQGHTGDAAHTTVRPAMTAEGILRVDTALTVATRASLLGYHQEHLEAAGRWEGAIERVVDEGAFLFDR